jgi:hypothetical protein
MSTLTITLTSRRTRHLRRAGQLLAEKAEDRTDVTPWAPKRVLGVLVDAGDELAQWASEHQPAKASIPGSAMNEDRRERERARRGKILARLRDLASRLASSELAWAEMGDDRSCEGGHGMASTEEWLGYTLLNREGPPGWFIGMGRALWKRIEARAARLSTETGAAWSVTDIVQLITEAAWRRLRSKDPAERARAEAWVRTEVLKPRVTKGQSAVECYVTSALGSSLNQIAEGLGVEVPWVNVLSADDIVRAYLMDDAFVDQVLAAAVDLTHAGSTPA